MPSGFRDSGIELIGPVPWGTHFCQFYDSKEDLTDILAPYFRAGLKGGEYCMWVTSAPVTPEAARRAMSAIMPDFDRFLGAGQMEILSHGDWYLKGGTFDLDRVLNGWLEKLADALKAGYTGLRVTGNTAWLERSDWHAFTEYEAAIDEVIGKHNMMALCTYELGLCGASEIIDVVRNHQWALIKRDGQWQILEDAERKRLRDALVASEERYRRIIETAEEGVWIIDEDMVTTFVNEKFARMLGYTAGEMAGKQVEALIADESLADVLRLARGYPGDERCDVRLLGKDGQPAWAIVSGSTLQEEGDRASRTLLMVTDISERRRMEDDLRSNEARLEETVTSLGERNRELEAFAQTAAHDLKGPLQLMRGYGQRLRRLRGDGLSDDERECLDEIEAASRQMAELIDGLLNLARVSQTEITYEDLDLSALAREAVADLVRREPERQVEVVIGQDITGRGDRLLVQTALKNLLENAWKFTSTRPLAQIEFREEDAGGDRVYAVRDNGVGFSMAGKEKLFAPFQRLHQGGSFPGSGIGLTTVDRIIARHGGRVWAESEIDGGSTFYFTLPLG